MKAPGGFAQQALIIGVGLLLLGQVRSLRLDVDAGATEESTPASAPETAAGQAISLAQLPEVLSPEADTEIIGEDQAQPPAAAPATPAIVQTATPQQASPPGTVERGPRVGASRRPSANGAAARPEAHPGQGKGNSARARKK